MFAIQYPAAEKNAPKTARHLLSIDDLPAEEITALLDKGFFYAKQNRSLQKKSNLLYGKTIINLFLENSTRTRVSFEIAGQRLGADVVNLSGDGSSLKKGESIIDTIQTLNAMQPDALIIRHGDNESAKIAAKYCHCPVLNAGSGTTEHPTQALLDAMTLFEHFGHLSGLKIAICGDIKHSRVASSNISLLTKMGADVRLIGPAELMPDDITDYYTDMEEGLSGVDAVMMLRIQKERMKNALDISMDDYFNQYGLTAEKLKHAKSHAVVLHPGPMNRGVEIDADLADDPERSLILKQVENGVAIRMACLDLLVGGRR